MKPSTSIKVKRGSIFYYDFGPVKKSIQSGIRPVLVIQCDEGNEASPTVIVAAMTTSTKKAYLPSHVRLSKNYGLRKPSTVMLEQISVVNKDDLQRYVGTIDDFATIKEINAELAKILGIRSYKLRQNEEIRCLCKNCLDSYMVSGQYRIRRANPYDRRQHPCDCCTRNGYEYAICRRNTLFKKGDTENA